MNLIEQLDQYPAWKLNRYEQPFDNGRVVDIIYSCAVCDGKNWSGTEYGSSPQLALDRAIADLDLRKMETL